MKRHAVFFTALCLGLALATPGLTRNKKKVRAKKLFDRGVAAIEVHDYKAALESFESAYHTIPHWMVLAHIGTCYAKLNNPVRAIWALEEFLEEGGEDIPPEERQSARQLVREQRRKVGVLHLIAEPRGSEAKIDGESIGRAPFERLLLKSGPHHIIVIIDQGSFEERDIIIMAGQEHTVRIPGENMGPAGAVMPTTPPPARPAKTSGLEEGAGSTTPSESSDEKTPDETPFDLGIVDSEEPVNGVSIPFYVALGLAGAGVIAGGVGWGFFIFYNESEKSHADKLDNPRPDEPDWTQFSWSDTCNSGNQTVINDTAEQYYCTTERDRRDYEDKARTAIIPAIAGTAVTAIAGGAAFLFYFHPEWFNSGSDKTASLFLTPSVSPSHSALLLSGRF